MSDALLIYVSYVLGRVHMTASLCVFLCFVLGVTCIAVSEFVEDLALPRRKMLAQKGASCLLIATAALFVAILVPGSDVLREIFAIPTQEP